MLEQIIPFNHKPFCFTLFNEGLCHTLEYFSPHLTVFGARVVFFFYDGKPGLWRTLGFLDCALPLSPCSLCSSHLGVLSVVWTDQAWFHLRSLVPSLLFSLSGILTGPQICRRWLFLSILASVHTSPPYITHSKLASSFLLPLCVMSSYFVIHFQKSNCLPLQLQIYRLSLLIRDAHHVHTLCIHSA